MRLAALLLVAIPVIAMGADTDTKSVQDTHGAQWKNKKLAELADELSDLEHELSEFKRSRQFVEANKVDKDIRALKKSISSVKKMTLQEAFVKYETEQRQRDQADASPKVGMVSQAEAKSGGAESDKVEYDPDKPLRIAKMGIVPNRIGTPEIVISVVNSSPQAIEAFKVDAEVFNKFGDAVTKGIGDNSFRGIDQERLKPGESRLCRWTLHLQQTAARADIWVSRVMFADGTEWTQDKETAQSRKGNFVTAKTND